MATNKLEELEKQNREEATQVESDEYYCGHSYWKEKRRMRLRKRTRCSQLLVRDLSAKSPSKYMVSQGNSIPTSYDIKRGLFIDFCVRIKIGGEKVRNKIT